MKFQITRTSEWAGCKPIPEAEEKDPGMPESPQKVWQIEIKSLTDLLGIIDKYGCVVVGKTASGFCVEIYDDYRE